MQNGEPNGNPDPSDIVLGPTGQFPEGKISEDDDGEIQIAVGVRDGVVVIEFGTEVKWIGLPPTQAREIAAMMVKHADYIEHRVN